MHRLHRIVPIAFVALGTTVFAMTGRRPAASPPPAAVSPFARFALPDARAYALHGRVVDQLEARPYVYLRLRDDNGHDTWVVTLARTAARSGRVDAWVLARAAQFDSPRLHRHFAPLAFGVVRTAAPGDPR